ncbi:DinB superfamily protein [Emticicia sp.]|uniref:DinB superfamily protein n=1 Tax=Emticicia sp. TaxID=1930953 RepID=UPI00375067F6
MIQSLIKLYDRDLQNLKNEIEAYNDENDLWLIRNEIQNSAGNLCLHLMGNLNHYIGHQLGNIDYVRNRSLEFSEKNVPKVQLIAKIEATGNMLKAILPTLSDKILAQKHTEEFYDGNDSNEYFLIHLFGHLNYHLGQINYHRRLINVK